MKNILRIGLVIIFLTTPLWAANDQPPQDQPASPGYGYGTEGMGPGMMGPGSGYHGHGPGMRQSGGATGYGMRGRSHIMGPERQSWYSMTPEQQKQWRQMRSQ